MKLAKSILSGIAALGFTAGAAIASEPPFMVYEEAYLMEPQSHDEQAAWDDSSYTAYGIDDDMDGRVDRMLILEQSDSLG